MNIRTYIASALFVGAVLFPGISQAFDVVDTAAYQVTEDTYLFTISYEVGYLNADAYLPVEATVGSGGEATLPNISFELQNVNGESMVGGQLVGIVLSESPVVDTMYYQVEKGKRETFTLLALYRGNERPQTLHVTSLGNVVNTGDKTSYIGVTAGELEAYQATLPIVLQK